MEYFLNINSTVFTIIGYPMSYVEFFGTLLYLWSVWLIAKKNTLTWPIGIISVILYMFLFYQIRLYSDAFEQVYYLIASLYGWWIWNKSPKINGRITDVKFSQFKGLLIWFVITFFVSVITGILIVGFIFIFQLSFLKQHLIRILMPSQQ